MTLKIVDSKELLAARERVVSRAECLRLGLTDSAVQNRVLGERWQRLYRGVYALHSGDPERAVLLWGALLRAGEGAVFSHQTAAEILGFLSRPSPGVHITVPTERHPGRWSGIPGVVIHRSSTLELTRRPGSVPCTRVEDTVLDLIAGSVSFDEKFGWVCRAAGARLTTAERILRALAARTRFPARREAEIALGYVGEGIMSWLEFQWVAGVERPHGLPAARRQVRVRQATGSRYLDNLYEKYNLCVELDGMAAHPEGERHRDNARDRWNLARRQIVTMRFDTASVHDRESRCAAAADLAGVLRDRDPDGALAGHACGEPGCEDRFAAIMARLRPRAGGDSLAESAFGRCQQCRLPRRPPAVPRLLGQLHAGPQGLAKPVFTDFIPGVFISVLDQFRAWVC